MATLSWILDVNAPNAARTFDEIGTRMAELDRNLRRTREVVVGDRDAMAKLARLQAQADRFGDRIHGMPLTLEGAAKAEATLLGLEATADRLNDKLSGAGASRRGGVLGGLIRGAGGFAAGGGAVIPGVGGGGAAAAASPVAAALGSVTGIVAMLAALPFAAQAAAGGIVTALGGGLAAIGVIGAAKTKQVKASFHGLMRSANADLVKIGQPFIPVLTSIAHTAGRVLGGLTGPLTGAMKILAPSFKTFSDSLLRAFGQPAMATAIKAIASAFGAILKAAGPQLSGDIRDVATGIIRVANSFARNAGQFAAVLSFFLKAAGFALSMVAALTSAAGYVEKHFIPALIHVRNAFRDTFHEIAVLFDAWRHGWAHAWDVVYGDTIGAVIRIDKGIIGWFGKLPGQLIHALWGLGHSLAAFMRAAWNEMWAAMRNVGGTILGWVQHWASSLWHGLLHFFHIGSPSGLFYDIGKNLMLGLRNGIADHIKHVAGAVGTVSGHVSGSVTSWITAALRIAGKPMSWLPALQRLVSLESGGNPRAVNPVTVMGEHASGLWQMLYSTFLGAGGRGGMMAMFNPIIEGVAALRYISGRYGSPFNIPGLFSGGYRGYASGGMITEPIFGIGRSGRAYGFGENGPEMVVPGRSSGATVNNYITVQVGHGTHPVAAAREIVDILNQGAKAGVKLRPSIMSSFG